MKKKKRRRLTLRQTKNLDLSGHLCKIKRERILRKNTCPLISGKDFQRERNRQRSKKRLYI